jgi:hypothetical protein
MLVESLGSETVQGKTCRKWPSLFKGYKPTPCCGLIKLHNNIPHTFLKLAEPFTRFADHIGHFSTSGKGNSGYWLCYR